VDIPHYSRIAAALESAGALSDPSECHGSLSGMLAALPDGEWRHAWLRLSLHGRDADDSGEALSLPADSRPVLDALYEGTCASLSDLHLRFQPLLPPDDQPIADRARALGNWCQGFLYGFSLARPGDISGLPGQVTEVLDDLARIAQVEQPDGEGNEQDEAALVEIIEYIRVASQLVHDELRLAGAPPASGRTH
jgi:uncharacterized protein YgfB (UPF0149 family)